MCQWHGARRCGTARGAEVCVPWSGFGPHADDNDGRDEAVVHDRAQEFQGLVAQFHEVRALLLRHDVHAKRLSIAKLQFCVRQQ